jgi:hypothetical protein
MFPSSEKPSPDRSSQKLLFLFLFLWLILNLTQALLSGLHPDEAYYWLYSRFLDWGYFDHPPMVGLFIKGGDMLLPGTVGLRLLTVLSSVGAVYFLWLIVKRYAVNVPLFIGLFSSVLLFHVYAFITTPDAPLLFFSVLFLYGYQRYLHEDTLKWAVFLGVVCAALLLSKYHGILLLLFILLSNLALLKRGSFWLILLLAVALCLPHVYWQYQNGYPSLHYHLFDRSATPYRVSFTAQYLLDQVLVTGPLVGWFLFASALKQKTQPDVFLKGLKFTLVGVFLFFFVSTFKGKVQAQWPLIEYIPLLILAYVSLAQSFSFPKWLKVLVSVNLALIVLARVLLMAAPGDLLKKIKLVATFNDQERWANQLEAAAQGRPVIFAEGFQAPSVYNYFNRTTQGFGYDSYGYRKTQFDLWPIEDSLRNKNVFYVLPFPHPADHDTISTVKGAYYGRWVDSVRLYQKVHFTPTGFEEDWQKGEVREVTFSIYNPYREPIHFSNAGERWKVFLEYGFIQDGAVREVLPADPGYEHIRVPAGESALHRMKIKAPDSPGKYKLFISVRTEPFIGPRNSGMINVQVK